MLLILFSIISYLFFDRWIAENCHFSSYVVLICKYLSKAVSPFFLLVTSFLSIILWRAKAARAFVTILISMFIVGNLKMLFRRPRPYLYLQDGLYGFFVGNVKHGFLSFPSSHAAVASGLATLFIYFYPKYNKITYLILAVLLATRIVLQEHFLSDILVGAWIGYIIAVLIVKTEKLLRTRSFSFTKPE